MCADSLLGVINHRCAVSTIKILSFFIHKWIKRIYGAYNNWEEAKATASCRERNIVEREEYFNLRQLVQTSW